MGKSMNDPDISNLMKAATERQLAVTALQKKYEQSDKIYEKTHLPSA